MDQQKLTNYFLDQITSKSAGLYSETKKFRRQAETFAEDLNGNLSAVAPDTRLLSSIERAQQEVNSLAQTARISGVPVEDIEAAIKEGQGTAN